MNPKDDILASLDHIENESWESAILPSQSETISEEAYFFEQEFAQESQDVIESSENPGKIEESQLLKTEIIIEEKQDKKSSKLFSHSVFLIKYFSTSLCIFGILMWISNYSAYSNIAYSFFFAEEMENTKNGLIQSVEAANIPEKVSEIAEVNTFKALENTDDTIDYSVDMHSVARLAAKTEQWVDLWIEITPYDNRVVIPKIWKNIPLIEIQEQNIEGMNELNDIFMKELENGIIRYPGSAKPWDDGNSFIFGHSSNFPWLDGDYNDVFALLDNVEYEDEVIVYYGQQKYIYKITKKEVISPGDVEVLKSNNQDRSEITLMTCWPIGTTFNRLVVVGELIHVQ